MIKIKYIQIAIIVLVLTTLNIAKAQQNNTMYYMHKLPQANLLNPAVQHECKLNFSGVILPIAGQILPPVHMNIGSTGFSKKNVMPWNDDIDSLMHPFHPDFDNERFLKRLRKVNYLTFETQINLLSVGYRWKKDYYFTLSVTEKFDYKFSFPKDLATLAYEGNGESFMGKIIDLEGLGLSTTYYREYALGASKIINNKLTLGVNAKILFGKVNTWTRKNSITWYTDSEDYDYAIHTDWEVNTSQPFYGINKFDYDYENDSLMFELDTLMDLDDPDIAKIIMNGKNLGFGIDIGAVYKYDEKITLYGSIIDIGYIRWKDNPQTLRANGTFLFDGYDVTHFLQEDDSLNEEIMDQQIDSVIHLFTYENQVEKYNTYLNPKIYLGGTYKINNMFTGGFLYRGELYQHRFLSSITLSGMANVKKWFSASLSYSIINNSFANVGAGLIFKTGPVQYFFITDNVLGSIWPQATRNLNLRLGINMMFGCKKKTSDALIN